MRAPPRIALGVLFLVGCIEVPPPPARAPRPIDPLDANWLSGATTATPTITAERLSAVLAIGKADPEVTALFAEAQARLAGYLAAWLAR